ncbi:unnamed protein product [Pseudo-nitzschia multistriata]|uniref:Uncharacterized protein n=1 Tax=Pseudo-nitzschia multistriata TaxID=183589 RepID=A0A448ZBF0_9STRA|nr:unnamed protein product [Pseudo-nitzschia multistriata]
MPNKKRGRPIPLAAPGLLRPMTSRKRARRVTTMFHKLTKERDQALKEGDADKARSCERSLEEMGGRPEYQRASQLSTSFHSTSRWVLGHLANNGWLYGIKKQALDESGGSTRRERRKQSARRRTTRILEVGAINTELLDAAGIPAAAATARPSPRKAADASGATPRSTGAAAKNIHVRAIDIHSMEERIEEADFLELPLVHPDREERYDVIVCSMVLNCVTTAVDRGKMLALLYHQLRPGGLCFFTVPKFCLTKSAFLTHGLFKKMLGEKGVGFRVVSTRESPRVAFFVLERPPEEKDGGGEESRPARQLDPVFTREIIRNKGKKFPNQFSVVLRSEHVFGTD